MVLNSSMLQLLDGPVGSTDWPHLRLASNEIWYEESKTTNPLTTSQVIFNRGKYEGSLLSEVSDTWYLKFMMEKNPDDEFTNLMFTKRLKELK